MVDVKLLKETIIESGMTTKAVCAKSGINRATWYNRLENPGKFTTDEIDAVCDTLNLTVGKRNAIFYAKQVPKTGTEYEI